MTQEEADKLGLLIGTADNGCSVCVRNMAERAGKTFTDWTFAVTDEIQREMPEWSDDPDDISMIGYVVKAIPNPKETP